MSEQAGRRRQECKCALSCHVSPGMNRSLVYSNGSTCLGSGTLQYPSTNTVTCFLSQQKTLICVLPRLHIYLQALWVSKVGAHVCALKISVILTLNWTESSKEWSIHKSFMLLPSCDKGTTCIPSLRKKYPVLVASGT